MDVHVAALRSHAAAHPHHVAVVDADQMVSYEELDRWSRCLTARLRQASSNPDRRVGYLGNIDLGVVVALLASHQAGMCVVWLDSHQPDAVLRDLIEHGSLDAVLHMSTDHQRAMDLHDTVIDIDAARHESNPEDECFGSDDGWAHIRYTSGSTGRPKGVPIGRAEMGHTLVRLHTTTNTSATDRVGLFGHFWPIAVFEAIGNGATLVVLDPTRDGPAGVVDEMRQHGVTIALTYTALFRQIADAATEPLQALRLAHLSGEPLRRTDVERFERMCAEGSELINSYGSSEFPLISFHRHRWGQPIVGDRVPLGRPYHDDEVDVIDDTGRSAGVGEIGMVTVRSPWLPAGYVDDPERTTAVFTTEPETGALIYRTGDLALQDADGVLHARGRRDDQVKVRGHTVLLGDVERSVQSHPQVRDCAVVAIDSPVGTKLVCRYVIESGESLSPGQLRRDLGAVVAGHLVPGLLAPIDELPTGENRKLDRTALLELGTQMSSIRPSDPRVREMHDLWEELLGHSAFDVRDDFFDVGGDSLLAMVLVERLERSTGVRVPFDRLLLDGASIEALVETIDRVDSADEGSAAMQLRSGNHAPPILLAPLLDGGISDYLDLVRLVNPSERVITLRVPGLDRRSTPSRSIPELVDHLYRGLNGEVPGLLIGYSFGATVAVELAHRLQSDGVCPRLVLIEPDVSWDMPFPRLRHVARTVLEGRPRLGLRRAGLMLGRAARAPLREVHTAALVAHNPSRLSGVEALVVTAEQSHMATSAATWRELLDGEVRHHVVPGDHLSVMRAPAIDEVARLVVAWSTDQSTPAADQT